MPAGSVPAGKVRAGRASRVDHHSKWCAVRADPPTGLASPPASVRLGVITAYFHRIAHVAGTLGQKGIRVTSVLIHDNHLVMAEGLATVLIGDGRRVAGIVDDLRAVLPVVRAERPDLCVIDRGHDDPALLAMLTELRTVAPTVRVLVLAAAPDVGVVGPVIDAGAAGYLRKTCGVGALIDAVRRVLAGEIVIGLHPGALPEATTAAANARWLAGHLTRRERECLAMLVDGLGTQAMTGRLGVSAATVRTHVQAMLDKLGVHSRLEAVAHAVRYSLLDERIAGHDASVRASRLVEQSYAGGRIPARRAGQERLAASGQA